MAHFTHIEIALPISIDSSSLILCNNATEIAGHLLTEPSFLLQIVSDGALLTGAGYRPAFDTEDGSIFIALADEACRFA